MNQSAIQRAFNEAPKYDGWSPPDMSVLRAGRADPPVMPNRLFGRTWSLIQELAEGAGAPVDYVAASVIAVAASLIGGKRRVRPFDTSNWDEPCILWVALVGDPSSNKSPAIDAATSLLRTIESAHAEAHRSTLQDFETKLERARAERKAWDEAVKAAVKSGEETPRMPDAAVMPEEPVRRRLLVQDATPEAVGAILAGNPFGTLHLRDELAGWWTSFDRYSPGGREFWLEAYGGRPHVIDRKGTAKPLQIPFNGVTVLGGVQPEKLADCLLSGADDGLIARFLWVWPDPVLFQRPRAIADTRRLELIYRRLESLKPRIDPFTMEPAAVSLPLNSKGGDIFEAWLGEEAANISDAASLFKGFCGKLKGMALRLALVSEFLAWADNEGAEEPTEVSERSLVAAIDFLEAYAKQTALRVFGDAALPPVERNAASLARYLLRNKLASFNAREIRDACGIPAMRETDTRDEAIALLVEADWLRASPSRKGDTKGRSRLDFEVNPHAFEMADG